MESNNADFPDAFGAISPTIPLSFSKSILFPQPYENILSNSSDFIFQSTFRVMPPSYISGELFISSFISHTRFIVSASIPSTLYAKYSVINSF